MLQNIVCLRINIRELVGNLTKIIGALSDIKREACIVSGIQIVMTFIIWV